MSSPLLSNSFFRSALLVAALAIPCAARALPMDNFLLTGGGNTITFTLLASPPGNTSTCPSPPMSCLPGPQTAFYLNAPVTFDGVTTLDGLAFPVARFNGGVRINATSYLGPQIFQPDAGTPTFTLGTFTLQNISQPATPYTLVITAAPAAPSASTPEPSSLALLATGTLSLFGLARTRRRQAS